MAYNQKQNAGRGNMPKTGRDIPLNMKSPVYMTDGPGDDLLESVKRDHPNKKVDRVKGKTNEFRLYDKSGHSVTLTRTPSKKKNNKITTEEAVQMALNKKSK